MSSASLESARSVTNRIYLLLLLAVLGVVVGYFIAPPAFLERNRVEKKFVQRHIEAQNALAELDRLALVIHVDAVRSLRIEMGLPQDVLGELALKAREEIEEQLTAITRLELDNADLGTALLAKRLKDELGGLLAGPGSTEALGRVLLVSEQLRQIEQRSMEIREETQGRGTLLENKYVNRLVLPAILAGIILAGFFIVRQSRSTVQFLTATIAQRDEQARALRRERDFVASLTETAPVMILLLDPQGIIQHANPFFEKTTGWRLDEIKDKDWFATFLPERDRERFREMMLGAIRGNPTRGAVHAIRTRSGAERLIEWNDQTIRNHDGVVTSLLAIGVDVTERKRLESQVLRTQRLESIGTLAGGLAHDLNNALGPIPVVMELLRQDFPGQGARYLDVINNGANRGIEIVKQLLTFARGTGGERIAIRPRLLLEEMEKLIRSTFPKNIDLRVILESEPDPVLGDSTQLHQVLLNLCVNARDALPQGGTLTLTARNVAVDKALASSFSAAKPGRYVLFQVRDTGVGIAPEVLERMFDPFFSTKGLGKGTGLGLSTVLGIVKSHEGFLRADSAPGRGSTFEFYLPIAGANAGTAPAQPKAAAPFRANGETILVVDDEPTICETARAALEGMNFNVLTATDGVGALILASENKAQLRAVIADLHMPQMDGLTLVRELKKNSPEVGVIVISGRMDERAENEFRQLGMRARLDKPFSLETLTAALKTIF